MTDTTPLVFISHSSQDRETAAALADLLRAALNLHPSEIRCTSVEGYRLPIGAETDQQLREELLRAPVFVALLSAGSLSSAYVLFEMGGRWGAKRQIAPLLATGFSATELRGPLTGINALSCESEEQLHQFLDDVSQQLQRPLNPTASYLPALRALRGLPGSPPSAPTTKAAKKILDLRVHPPEASLSDGQLQVLRVFATAESYVLWDSDVARALGWKQVKALHYIESLLEAKYLWKDTDGFKLTRAGRSLVVELNLVED